MKKKILALGDYEHVQYHAFGGVDKQLEGIFAAYDLTCSADYPSLTPALLKGYDLVVNYISGWGAKGTRRAAGALLSYVADGGALLSLHNGIIMHTNPELEMMQGGVFTGHPEACMLAYTPADAQHPILKGIEPFAIHEEPYRFSIPDMLKPTMLLRYAHDGQDWPAAWVLPYGLGGVVYLSIGHSDVSFENAAFRQLIVNSAEWLMQQHSC